MEPLDSLEFVEPAEPVERTSPSAPSREPGPDRPDPHLNPVHARNLFLEGGSILASEVRAPILDSWQRSRFWGVDTDHIQAPYNADFDPHSRLATAAQPVLDRLSDALQGTPTALILTDSK